jgi:hypothetical protein
MFGSTKYIVVEEDGMELPIVFASFLMHSVVAGDRTVLAAGFVLFKIDWEGTNYEPIPVLSCDCYGKSESLNISSRPEEDSKLIEQSILQK